MTQQAHTIMIMVKQGLDTAQILAEDVASTEFEVEFIIEQLRVNGYL